MPKHPEFWTITPAGGEGRRLSPLTAALYGRSIPKQVAAVASTRTRLAQTLERLAPRSLTLLCSCALLVACGGDSPPPPDAGTDADVLLDGGPTPDGGPEDAGTDAGLPDAGPTAPVVTSAAPTEATEGAAYLYAVTCTDPNGDAVMVAEGAADTCGGVVTGTTYAFMPTESQGGTSCVVAVECSDGTEMVPQTTTVTIAETDSPPTLTNLPATVFTVHGLAGLLRRQRDRSGPARADPHVRRRRDDLRLRPDGGREPRRLDLRRQRRLLHRGRDGHRSHQPQRHEPAHDLVHQRGSAAHVHRPGGGLRGDRLLLPGHLHRRGRRHT
jgi:hypothetical protein